MRIQNTRKEFGFNEVLTEIGELDWKLGGLSDRTILQSDGQWDDLPTFEHQAQDFETWACTCYATLSQIEMYFKRKFGFEPNYSDRYIYNLVGINPPGGNPHKAYEAVRKYGVLEELEMPRTATYEEYKTPRPMPDRFKNKGQKWGYTLTHEWIASRDKSRMKGKIIDALQYSPVCVAVTAWHLENGVYVDKGQPNTHWSLVYGYDVREDGIYLRVFDSYDNSLKVLDKDHRISYAKGIRISQGQKKVSFWDWLRSL